MSTVYEILPEDIIIIKTKQLHKKTKNDTHNLHQNQASEV
jgi:hypothetical protein